MRINTVNIKNFRCYYGENKIEFNNDGKITLIWGDSGYGKSSFLQFFRWIMYDDPDFGKSDDKPLFNTVAFSELKKDETLEVKGVLEFEHLKVKYSLEKKLVYSYSLDPENAKVIKQDRSLQWLNKDNWELYDGSIEKKINSIMPKGLSKYFLLDGEKARELVLNADDLKKAIYALFGIDAYEKAIDHIGSSYKKKSVIGYYSNIMTSKMPNKNNVQLAKTPAEFQENLEELYEEIQLRKKERKELEDKIKDLNQKRDDLLKSIGKVSNKKNLEELIKRNDSAIANKELEIDKMKSKIGDLFYRTYPYLLLVGVTSKCSSILREKQDSFSVEYHDMFNNLKKNLLEEILEKGQCVCGRSLDDNSIKFIKDTITIMPPDSYAYQFGQFVKKSKQEIMDSKIKIYDYDTLLGNITKMQQEIAALNEDTKEKLEEIKKLDSAKDLLAALDMTEKNLVSLGNKKDTITKEIAEKEQISNIAESQLKKLIEGSKVSSKYTTIISFFKDLLNTLVNEKKKRETEVAEVLDVCVKEVFKKISTQVDLDLDNIQFVNKDFSLRSTFLSGGQLAVDEYSYVIGIVKALQNFGLNNNENPIIIDAPFAFTGNEQSEHIFKTLPEVVKQTILLTLDLNKIKDLLIKDTNSYELYIIKNKSQDKATIERGKLNAIKF